MSKRHQKQCFALFNAKGDMRNNQIGETRANIYNAYGSKRAAIEDRWRVRAVSMYFYNS